MLHFKFQMKKGNCSLSKKKLCTFSPVEIRHSCTEELGKLKGSRIFYYSLQRFTILLIFYRERHLQYDQASIRRVSLHLLETEKISCAAYAENHRLLLGTNQGCQLFLDVFNSNCSSITFNSG